MSSATKTESSNNGPIRGIIFCEFHPTAGPVLTYQVPENFGFSKDQFDSLSEFVIPKKYIANTVSTVSALGYKIVGCPVSVSDDSRYDRNLFIFNTCFVFDSATDSVSFEATVGKLARYLRSMELQNAFLSSEESKERNLPRLLRRIMADLNASGQCTVRLDESNLLFLQRRNFAANAAPPPVQDHDVPVPIVDISSCYDLREWDLTTQRVLRVIDGISHVARIANKTGCEISMVRQCVRSLVYYGLIKVVPVFLYSCVFRLTHRFPELPESREMQGECIDYVTRDGARRKARFGDVFSLYCAMKPGLQIRDICIRFNPHSMYVDVIKLVQFGLIKKFVRCMQSYPTYLPPLSSSTRPSDDQLLSLLDGTRSYSDICCAKGTTYADLEQLHETNNSDVVVCLK